MEDIAAMLEQYPDWNSYWSDKRADMSKIKVPAYILASYSTCLHTEGSFRCYEEMTAPKWSVSAASHESSGTNILQADRS